MAWSLATVRDTLKTRIRAYNSGELQAYDTMPATPVLPCAIVYPTAGAPFVLTPVLDSDVNDLAITVLVIVAKVVDENAQNTLDGYASAAGICDAIDSGKVSNVWDYAMTDDPTGYGTYTFGDGETGQSYLGFTIPVAVAVS